MELKNIYIIKRCADEEVTDDGSCSLDDDSSDVGYYDSDDDEKTISMPMMM